MEDGKYLYFVDFENLGGLISPLPVTIEYENGTSEEMMIPAEIWRRNSEKVTKLFSLDNRAVGFKLDVQHQTADADFSNNSYPQTIAQSRIELYKSNRSSSSMMADMLRELHSEKSDDDASDKKTVPMGEAKDEMSEKPKKEEKAKSEKKDDEDDKKSSLRRTLERMLERR
jgi:hypothetical protein